MPSNKTAKDYVVTDTTVHVVWELPDGQMLTVDHNPEDYPATHYSIQSKEEYECTR